MKTESDTVPFHPYYTAKDGFGLARVPDDLLHVRVLCAQPLGHPDNYIPANPMQTPAHIVPEWYFWPFYAILRSFTTDFLPARQAVGVLAMFCAILVWFFMPWLDTVAGAFGPFPPGVQKFFWLLVIDVAVLGYCGGSPAEEPYLMICQIASAYYFLHFLVVLPIVSSIESTKPLPFSITEAVLGHDDAVTA